MNFINTSIRFLIFSNIYVSFSASILAYLSFSLRNSSNFNFVFFVFFSKLFLYNFNRLKKKSIDLQKKRNHFIEKNYKSLILFTLVTLIISLTLFNFVKWPNWIIFLLMIISILYSIDIKFKNKIILRKFRNIPYIKIFLISFTWSCITDLIPSLIIENKINYNTLIQRFLFVISITIPFDIRDKNIDSNYLKTLPQIFGKNKSLLISIFLIFVCEVLVFYQFFFLKSISLKNFLVIYFSYEISIVLIYIYDKIQKNFFMDFTYDGLPIIMGLLFFLSNLN